MEPLQHDCDVLFFLFRHHLSGHESAMVKANKLATTAKAMNFMVLGFCSLTMSHDAGVGIDCEEKLTSY